ncbi:AMP-binding protein [Streptomyces sp. NPDC091268]|uniref:AMP-binding protein n=1 Tax=Streptomyces sp. NPDC091268 TaxID=3365979 RepID=UPI00382B701B
MTQGSEFARSGSRTDDTVLHHFERRAREVPDLYALIAGTEGMTYGQLDARANQLAHHLLDAGLPPGGVVAVGTARPADVLVAVLAVLKASGTYAVVDVESARTGQAQLAGIRPFALLTHAAHQARLDDGSGLRVIRLGADGAEIAGRPTRAPARPEPCTTAAVLFTGGGAPRPVAVGHDLLLAAYEGWAEVAGPTNADRHLITAGPDHTSFAAGWTRALCSGGALVLPGRTPWTTEAIHRAVAAERVTVLHTDPGAAAHLFPRPRPVPAARVPEPAEPKEKTDPLRSLRMITVTGERLFLDEVAALQTRLRPGARVLDVYGLTESAGFGTWFELSQLPGPLDDPEGISLIGRPFPGCSVSLRGGEIHLTPPNGGDAIPTGDLGVLRPDGLLQFGGRIRDRLTLGGKPVDPHPVEALLRTHPGVGGALLTGPLPAAAGSRRGPGGPGQDGPVAYICPPAGATAWPPGSDLPDVGALRRHVAGSLRTVELPAVVVKLRTLPRNRAGQEDRAGLPLPAGPGEPARAVRGGGKYAGSGSAPAGGDYPDGTAVGCMTLVLGLGVLVLTDAFWPGSTDRTGVPSPWSGLFLGLYLCEAFAFAGGLLFLLFGRSRMMRQGRDPRLTKTAHLAIVYLLAAWWPQDNFYRLAAKQDWPRQAALVYAFNVPLMIAGALVVLYVTRKPASGFDFDSDRDAPRSRS